MTETVTTSTMQKDTPVVRSYIPRSQKIIAWVEQHANEIDNRKAGNLKISFKNESLQICEELFHQIT